MLVFASFAAFLMHTTLYELHKSTTEEEMDNK
jgi:hypothetical protein